MKRQVKVSNRREFMRGAGKLLIVSSVSTSMLTRWPTGSSAAEGNDYDLHGHRWAMSVDIERCIGCGACVRACKAENDVLREPFYFRTWVERYHLPDGDIEHPHVDSPNGAYDGFPELPDAEEGGKSFFVPKLCNHCEASPCVQVCPVGATFDSPDGVVLVDRSYCLGCRYCIQACPYGSRYIDPRTHTVDKCTLCYHRITRGLTTACCEVCPTGARQLGDLKDPESLIHSFLRDNQVQVLKPHMATSPKVYYSGLDGSVR
jgi:Fe-S-cluster-containing dehydrogenase component